MANQRGQIKEVQFWVLENKFKKGSKVRWGTNSNFFIVLVKPSLFVITWLLESLRIWGAQIILRPLWSTNDHRTHLCYNAAPSSPPSLPWTVSTSPWEYGMSNLRWVTSSVKVSYSFKNVKTAVKGQMHRGKTLQLHAVNWFNTSCTDHCTKNEFLLLSLHQINHSKTQLSQLRWLPDKFNC